MPTIELVSINQSSPVLFEDLPFAVEVDNQLKSHRYPSLFQTDFDLFSGYIYHLGGFTENNNDGGIFTAYELLSNDSSNQAESRFVEFKKEIFPFIQIIIKTLLDSSPSGEVIFTSDYQFSENNIQKFESMALDTFCELHNKKELLFNASYKIINQVTA